ncbi:unnamed protein product, partial [Cyprideis torosa]
MFFEVIRMLWTSWFGTKLMPISWQLLREIGRFGFGIPGLPSAKQTFRQKLSSAFLVLRIGENINIAWHPDGNLIAVGSKED